MNTRANFKAFFKSQNHNLKFHDETLDDFYNKFLKDKISSNEPELIALAGSYGSGKTYFCKTILEDKKNHFIDNVDEVMLALPGYQATAAQQDKISAFNKWRDTAEQVANIMLLYAMHTKLNIIMDRTCSSTGSLLLLKKAKNREYKMEMFGFVVSDRTAMERILKRSSSENRLVTKDSIQVSADMFSYMWQKEYLNLFDKLTLLTWEDKYKRIFTKNKDKTELKDSLSYDNFRSRGQNSVLSFDFTSKKAKPVAVITGASRGIGRALALELAKRGIYVVAIARTQSDLVQLQAQSPDNIRIIDADITTDVGRKKIVKSIQDLKINYLIHNAAVIKPIGKILSCGEADLRALFDVNLFAPILLTQKLGPLLKDNNCRILNITSVAGQKAVDGLSAYCISKSGLNMFTMAVRPELSPRGILIAGAIPGEVDTPMQALLRNESQENLPSAEDFNLAKQHNALIPPETCAKWLANILLETSDAEYSAKEWNIYQDYQGPLPRPLNKEKLGIEAKNNSREENTKEDTLPKPNVNPVLLSPVKTEKSPDPSPKSTPVIIQHKLNKPVFAASPVVIDEKKSPTFDPKGMTHVNPNEPDHIYLSLPMSVERAKQAFLDNNNNSNPHTPIPTVKIDPPPSIRPPYPPPVPPTKKTALSTPIAEQNFKRSNSPTRVSEASFLNQAPALSISRREAIHRQERPLPTPPRLK